MPSPIGREQSAAGKAAGLAARSGKALIDRVRHTPDGAPGTPGSDVDAARVLTVAGDAVPLRDLLLDPARLAHLLAEPYTGEPTTWTVLTVEAVEDRVRFAARSGQPEPLEATGSLSFAPAPQDLGTEVTLALRLEGPDLAAGAMAHKVLRRLKALAETGEIPTLAHNPSARHEPTTDHPSEGDH